MIKKYFVKLLSINLLLISFTSLADVQDDTNTAMLLKCNGGFGNISLNGSKPKYGHVGKNLKITAEETSSWDTAYAWFITSPSYFNSPLNKSDVEGVGDYLAQSGLFDQIEELTGDADEDEFTYSNFTRGGPWAVTIATIDVDFDWSWPPFGMGGIKSCDSTPVYIASKPTANKQSLTFDFNGYIDASVTYTYDTQYSKAALEGSNIKFEWKYVNYDYSSRPTYTFLTYSPTSHIKPPTRGFHKVYVRVWDGGGWGNSTYLGMAEGGFNSCVQQNHGCQEPL